MLLYPHIDPVALRLGPLHIRWYGLMYILGYIFGFLLFKLRLKETRLPMRPETAGDLVLYVFAGMLLGARIGYVLFYNPVYYAQHPAEIVAFWTGGLSFHGAMCGIVLAGWLFAKREGLAFYHLADTVAPVIPIGLALGRMGNFINGELYGRVAANVPWAMAFPTDPLHLPRHPSQLYELGMEGVLLTAILWGARKLNLPHGALFWLFMTCYGTFRIIGEQFREPDPQLSYIFPGVSAGMIVSAPMLAIGLVMLTALLVRGRRPAAPAGAAEAA